MRTFKKVGFLWLIALIFYCTFLISAVLFICQLGVSVIFYFSDSQFLFSWKDAFHIALKKGCIVGSTLGMGLWIKAKVEEKRRKKVQSEKQK